MSKVIIRKCVKYFRVEREPFLHMPPRNYDFSSSKQIDVLENRAVAATRTEYYFGRARKPWLSQWHAISINTKRHTKNDSRPFVHNVGIGAKCCMLHRLSRTLRLPRSNSKRRMTEFVRGYGCNSSVYGHFQAMATATAAVNMASKHVMHILHI